MTSARSSYKRDNFFSLALSLFYPSEYVCQYIAIDTVVTPKSHKTFYRITGLPPLFFSPLACDVANVINVISDPEIVAS
jgi:hypothetical protein